MMNERSCASANMEIRMDSAEKSKIIPHAVWQRTTPEIDTEVKKLWLVIVGAVAAIGSAVWTLSNHIS
jgi:hypothetical protein